jgi:hypothetical protein
VAAEFSERPANFSPEVEPLVQGLVSAAQRNPPHTSEVRRTLLELLHYLVTPRGRTDANCRATESALAAASDWEYEWPGLPRDYQAVLFDLSTTLHDTVVR